MKYFVEMMNGDNYNKFMNGNINYRMKVVEIEAENMDEAIAKAIANYPNMIINNTAKSAEEIEEEKVAAEAQAIKEELQKIKKENREIRKAYEMGMTVEDYRAYNRIKANKKRHEANVRKIQEAIRQLEKELAYEERKVQDYEKMIAEYENN